MAHADKPVNRRRIRKRTALLLILALGGLASLFVGLQWEAVLRTFATDLARTENFFNLINPNHISLAHAIVAGTLGLGHFLLLFGIIATLVGLSGAAYTHLRSTDNLRWRSLGFHRAFLFGTGAMMLLAVGTATWMTSAVSYENKLATEPQQARKKNITPTARSPRHLSSRKRPTDSRRIPK